MRALVLALNPAIDAEWQVDRVQWEEKNVLQAERRWAGGKGINVARWLRYLGGKPRILLPLGGHAGADLKRFLRYDRIAATTIPICEPTRVNVVVTTAKGQQIRFNPAGPTLSKREWHGVLHRAKRM